MSLPNMKTLTLGDKLKLLAEVATGDHKKKDIAKKHGIPCSTLSTIWVQRERYMELARAGAEPGKKRAKSRKFPQVEGELWDWIQKQTDSALSGVRIRRRAQLVAKKLGCAGFKASVAWLEGFQQRYRFKTEKGKLLMVAGPCPLSDPEPTENEEFILLFNNPEDTDAPAPTASFPILQIKQEPAWLKDYEEPPNQDANFPSGPSANQPFLRRVPNSSEGRSTDLPNTQYPKDTVFRKRTPAGPSTSVGGHEQNSVQKPSKGFVPSPDKLTDYHLQCFGSYIVSELKQMDPRTCVMVQRTINDIIFDAKIKRVRN